MEKENVASARVTRKADPESGPGASDAETEDAVHRVYPPQPVRLLSVHATAAQRKHAGTHELLSCVSASFVVP